MLALNRYVVNHCYEIMTLITRLSSMISVMFAHIHNVLADIKLPSSVFALGDHLSTGTLHCVPEDGFFESSGDFAPSGSPTFKQGGATEQAHEWLGTVRLGKGEWTVGCLNHVLALRVRKLWAEAFGKEPSLVPQDPKAYAWSEGVDVALLIDEVLRPAALDEIRARQRQEDLAKPTNDLPVYLVPVYRSRRGRILEPNLTSFPH